MNRRPSPPAEPKRLDPDVAEALDQQLTPAQPGDDALLQRVRSRVMHSVAHQSQSALHATVRAGAQPWLTVARGVERKLLYEGTDSVSVLLRIAPGTTVAGHGHAIDEECLVLEGTLRIGSDLLLNAGDFHVGLKGVPHADARTDTGAVVFLRESRRQPEGAAA